MKHVDLVLLHPPSVYDFRELPLDTKGTTFDFSGGTIFDGDLGTYKPISSFQDPYFKENVSESIARSWYDGDWQKHPWEEETVPKAGAFNPAGKYSWSKSPRFQGRPMQVGPLAQVFMGYAAGHEPTMRWGNLALEMASKAAGAKIGTSALHSTLGRHVARTVRCAVLAELGMKHWELLATNIGKGDVPIFNPPTFPPLRTERVRLSRGPAGDPVPLDRDGGREDPELPGGGPLHV